MSLDRVRAPEVLSLDDARFDTLTRSLTELRSRRRLAKLLGAIALGESLAGRIPGEAAAKKRPDRQYSCGRSGKVCSRKSKAHSAKQCKRCCETFTVIEGRGRCCSPNGNPCETDQQCCLGSCSVGVCQSTAIQLPSPPSLGLRTPCNTAVDCNSGVQVGDTCPNRPNQCALIQPRKGPRTCEGSGVPVCCRPDCGVCSDDCECCGDLRCRNGNCAPPPCHQRGEACTDGEPCCAGAGACNGAICCLADGASCPCGEPGNCQGCCSGICGADGRCGSGSACVPYGQPCAAAECCNNVPCSGNLCRFN